MELEYFKDMLFEALNETDELNIEDIETNDSENSFEITTTDGSVFEVTCRKIK